MSARTLKPGLIGCGRTGTTYAEHLTSRIRATELVMVADAFEDAAGRYGVPFATQDYHDILAQAGKHIFCEKPIAIDLASIDRALDAVESAGVKLQIGFNRRFDANYRRIRQAIEQGEIGRPQLLHLISSDLVSPSLDYIRASGGPFSIIEKRMAVPLAQRTSQPGGGHAPQRQRLQRSVRRQ